MSTYFETDIVRALENIGRLMDRHNQLEEERNALLREIKAEIHDIPPRAEENEMGMSLDIF